MKFDRPNEPNAARLVESLRFLGYGNYEAIADLVDNSIDADAHTINVRLSQKNQQPQIVISDDGVSMPQDTLDQAMRLGSLTSRDIHSDLGKFGMGLVTASLSIARRCHVIARTSDGTWSSAWDVDEIQSRNAFVKHFAPATEEEEAQLSEAVGDAPTGTLVLLTKCDNLSNKNMSSFANVLRAHLGRVHRFFIAAGRQIFVNGEEVVPIDPLQLGDTATEIVLDDVLAINYADEKTSEKKSENVRVRIALVAETPVSDLDIGRSLKAQGFYVLRNLREIMSADSLGFFTKHNDFNRMRGEIFFPGTLDRLVGVEFTKRQVELEQSVSDQLAAILVPVCRTIKRREASKKRVQSTDDQLRLHAQAVRAIAEKDKLLIKPKAIVEKRSSSSHREASPRNGSTTDRERKNLSRTQLLETRLNCEFREEKLGPNGQVYECDMEGRRLVIRYNIEHPFYQKFVSDNINELRAVTAADFLVYSMASAELKIMSDGELDAVNNFKAVMSANLRTLLN